MKPYDATQEHKPFEKQPASNRHPNKGRNGKNPYTGNSKRKD